MAENEFISMMQEEIGLLVKQVNNPEFNILFSFLDERISAPESFVVMLGETSSGKSTLINGLLGSYELTVGAAPTSGTITEIMDNDKINNFEYYAVNNDATVEKLSKSGFDKLLNNPDANLLRVRLFIKKYNHDLQYLRLFDTPGYGAIQEYHEEIIKDFIPQGDIIIYVVSYRTGFQNNDNNFITFINNLIDEETQFYLVINRVPEGTDLSDNRINEISRHASDCLHREISPYIVNSIIGEENIYVLPEAKNLWSDISHELKSENRLEKISTTYINLQKDLLIDIENYLSNMLLAVSLSDTQQKELITKLKCFMKKKLEVTEEINKTFNYLNRFLISLFKKASEEIITTISKEVNIANKWTEIDDCKAFVVSHLLPINTDNQIEIIRYTLQTELSILDEKINNILNIAVAEFKKDIKIPSAAFENLLKGLSEKTMQKAAGYGLREFFAQFGGAGGTGAGVANAAKKGLKIFGDMIGKKFSRETHNAVAKFLSKIGATSAKAVTSAAAVIVETVFYIYDALTWQKKLLENVSIGVDNWKNETLQKSQKENEKLRETNINNIDVFFKQYELSFKFDNFDKNQIQKDKIELMLSKVRNLKNQIDLKLNKLKSK